MTFPGRWRLAACPLALAAAMMVSACSSPKIDNELYNTLHDILEEQQTLWDRGGGKPADITGQVCPLVSFRTLDRMNAEIGNTKITGKTYIANGMGIHPNKSYQYFIRKKINIVTTSFLYVVMNENGYCNAQYRQYNF